MARRLFWVAGILLALMGLAVGALLAIPWLLHDRMAERLEQVLDEALLADVEIGEVSLGVITTFPTLRIDVDELAIVGTSGFEGVELMRVDRAELGVDLLSALVGDTPRVERIVLESPRFDMRIAEDGSSNLDIFPEENVAAGAEVEADAGPWSADLDAFVIRDLSLVYLDAPNDLEIGLSDLDLDLQGTVGNPGTRLDTHAEIASLTVGQGGIQWLTDTQWSGDVGLNYNGETGTLEFLDNEVTVNALTVAFAGEMVAEPNGDTTLALSFDAKDAAFANLLSLVPAAYGDDFAGVDAEGRLTLGGKVEGTYSEDGTAWPSFGVDLEVADARFQFPSQPVGVDHVELEAHIAHPQGEPDLMTIDVERVNLTTAGSDFVGTLHVKQPLSDPDLDLTAKGGLDIGRLILAFPDVGLDTEGLLNLDVQLQGRTSDLAAGRAEAIEARGTVQGTRLHLMGDELPVPVTLQEMDLTLDGAKAELKRLDVSWPGSDGVSGLSLNGDFDSFLPYFIGKEGEIVGDVSVSGSRVDLRPWAASSEGAPGSETPTEEPADEAFVVPVPDNVNLTCKLNLQHVITDAFEVDEVKGVMAVQDQVAQMRGVTGEMLGGKVELGGSYASDSSETADVDLAVRTIRVDLARTFAQFETLRRIAPLLEGAVGKLDTDLSLKTELLSDGTPILGTLVSTGTFRAAGLELQPSALAGVAEELKLDEVKTLKLSAREMSFAIRGGTARLNPMNVQLGRLKSTVAGKARLISQSVDFTFDFKVPLRRIRESSFVSSLGGDIPRQLDVRAQVVGPYASPDVRVALQGTEALVESATEAVVEQLKQLAEEQGVTEAVARARSRGDALVAEAEEQAKAILDEAASAGDELRALAKAKGDRLVKEAGSNLLKSAVAKRAAKAAEKEADKAATRLVGAARERAEKLIAEAKDHRESLIAQASAAARGG